MDNLEDTESHAKISDSAYSNSCSNSQSRRSHSSKSTHSGSHSSGSSGYGGKPSTSNCSTNLDQPPQKRSKDIKKKKQVLSEVKVEAENVPENRIIEPAVEVVLPQPEISPDIEVTAAALKQPENGPIEIMDIGAPEGPPVEVEAETSNQALVNSTNINASNQVPFPCNGFSCVISMHDGVVIYTTSSLTTSLGFPKHMWIGRSFIDFVHPRDRNTFASQITNGLALPKNVNGTQEKVPTIASSVSTMVCRIRRYRGLTSSFAVKERTVVYVPFLLKLSFKNITDDEGKVIYLVIQATQFVSAFKIPNEILTNPIPFVIRHAANGNLEYIDPESVPYLGYLPQDLADKDALQLYHPCDLGYLRQVYETIVKEGGVPCSKPYRILTQNGDYVKVETEWSSFINPWSRKLEFVIGKHHIIEGPTNPDVFQIQRPEKCTKISPEEKCKATTLRETIVRIMNEVLTKPAEVAKQHMTKRCQDLASFMESLIEEDPKAEEELRVEIQEPDHSYYERDSVMLGGISPHHDYNDSKSSSETPLSYNQLNYNENLQRYFDSHQPYSYEDYNTVAGENILDLNPKSEAGPSLSPTGIHSDSAEVMSASESSGIIRGASPVDMTDYQPIRLTESLLNKHNTEMEKKLVKIHRENRSSSKGEREKVSIENRQKKKEHLARCNSTFQPAITTKSQTQGLKRSSKLVESAGSHKHHCSSPRQTRHKQTTSAMMTLPTSTTTTTLAGQYWSPNPVNSMNTFFLGVGLPQQMSIMSPIPAVQGMFPLYFAPSHEAMPSSSDTNMLENQNNNHFKQTVPCMMYGQALYGSPFMYSPISPQVTYPLQENLMNQTLQFSNAFNNSMSPINKAARDQKFAGVSKSNVVLKAKSYASGLWRDKNRAEFHLPPPKDDHTSADSNSSTNNNISNQSAGAVTDRLPSGENKLKGRLGTNEDRTDGESSYSSFYSSFFKTDSGSGGESGESKKAGERSDIPNTSCNGAYYSPDATKKATRRKMEPPWMEQVCLTSELIYKYQIFTKNLDEVLVADKQKISALEQPSMVNEQLGQLYMDLQLEGVAARLTLEEGITSSSSSGEESTSSNKVTRRKREYSKLVFIYEEETPLPPPPVDDELAQPECSVDAVDS